MAPAGNVVRATKRVLVNFNYLKYFIPHLDPFLEKCMEIRNNPRMLS